MAEMTFNTLYPAPLSLGKGRAYKEEKFMDKLDSIRSLPFTQLAGVLGINLHHFKRDNRKGDWIGPCPIHNGKNPTAFRYHDSGMFNCFACPAKGKNAITLTMQ